MFTMFNILVRKVSGPMPRCQFCEELTTSYVVESYVDNRQPRKVAYYCVPCLLLEWWARSYFDEVVENEA